MEKTDREIWKDLFLLDLGVNLGTEKSFYDHYQDLKHLSYAELAYRLFIYRTRRDLFGEDIQNLRFYAEKSFGIVEYAKPKVNSPDDFKTEVVHILYRGVVYRISTGILTHSLEADAYRKRFIKTLKLKIDEADSSIPIYGDYKRLSYSERTSHQGMILLYLAWSHVPEEKGFLREMIQFLERGENNKLFLNSLYSYAYEKFGTNFSNRENKKEDPMAKLERKISEEGKKEQQEIKQSDMGSMQENFKSVEEKMEYYLKRAKQQGDSLSGQQDMLISE